MALMRMFCRAFRDMLESEGEIYHSSHFGNVYETYYELAGHRWLVREDSGVEVLDIQLIGTNERLYPE